MRLASYHPKTLPSELVRRRKKTSARGTETALSIFEDVRLGSIQPGSTKRKIHGALSQNELDRYAARARRHFQKAPQARVADSSSTNAVNFSSARTTKRFPLSRCASAIQIVRPLESIAEMQPQLKPALLRLSAMISQYRTRWILLFCSPHSDDKVNINVSLDGKLLAMRPTPLFDFKKKLVDQAS
jgi:hypothetical protein